MTSADLQPRDITLCVTLLCSGFGPVFLQSHPEFEGCSGFLSQNCVAKDFLEVFCLLCNIILLEHRMNARKEGRKCEIFVFSIDGDLLDQFPVR